MAHLLLIDDDAVFVPEQVRQTFPAPAHRVVVAENGNHGVELVSYASSALEDPRSSREAPLARGFAFRSIVVWAADAGVNAPVAEKISVVRSPAPGHILGRE